MKHIGLLLWVVLVLSACRHPAQVGSTHSLASLEALNAKVVNPDKVSVTSIRLEALRDTALSIGAQSGLAFRSKQINRVLSKAEHELDLSFHFGHMMLAHNILPPVLVESNASTRVADEETLRTADKTYQIISPARFVVAPPTWREYLAMNFDWPKVPDNALLPKTEEEKKMWQEHVRRGWIEGLRQGDDMFFGHVQRLVQDYRGMILYRTLLAKNMVSPPFVAESQLGITGDRKRLDINDKVLRMTAQPGLNTNSTSWQAIPTPPP